MIDEQHKAMNTETYTGQQERKRTEPTLREAIVDAVVRRYVPAAEDLSVKPFESEVAHLHDIVVDAQKLQAGLQQQYDSHQESINNTSDFAARSSELASSNVELAGHNTELVATNIELQKELHDARNECCRHEASFSVLQEQLQRLENDLQGQEQSMRSTATKLQSQTEKLAQATKRVEESERIVRLQAIEIGHMRTQLDQANKEHRVNGSRTVAERMIIELKRKVQHSEARNGIVVSHAEVNRVNELLAAAGAELKSAEEECCQLKDQLNDNRETAKIELSRLEERLATANSRLEQVVEDNRRLMEERDATILKLECRDTQSVKLKSMLTPAIDSEEEDQRTRNPVPETCDSVELQDIDAARAHTKETESQELMVATDTEVKLVRGCITIVLVDASCVMVAWLLNMPTTSHDMKYFLFLGLLIADGSYLALVIG